MGTCLHKIRLANIGGTPSVVTNYGIEIKYGDEIVYVQSTGEARAENKLDKLYSDIDNFNVLITPEQIESPLPLSAFFSKDYVIDFPVRVDDAVDLYAQVAYFYKSENYLWQTSAQIAEARDADHAYNPIEITYWFKTASDMTKKTSTSVSCLHLQKLTPTVGT